MVVLPASMCAMIPMFRVRSRGNSRLAILLTTSATSGILKGLPAQTIRATWCRCDCAQARRASVPPESWPQPRVTGVSVAIWAAMDTADMFVGSFGRASPKMPQLQSSASPLQAQQATVTEQLRFRVRAAARHGGPGLQACRPLKSLRAHLTQRSLTRRRPVRSVST